MSELDRPLSLKQVCELIFNNTISIATLKAEHRRGNLELFKIGRQYFTTRRHIEALVEKCRLQGPPRAPKREPTDNWPEEVRRRAALAAVRLSVEKLKAAARKKNS
ncbi:hypothetical protein [Bradyrhizobium neotropicale]|uniref:hypothetical protein n=1 Tax=Bradyrhizobium neotropicale TaxID=1497615 RepID=UPI0011AB5E38|nr:hypothetical protein [Bradyrhizobium neotropicale]